MSLLVAHSSSIHNCLLQLCFLISLTKETKTSYYDKNLKDIMSMFNLFPIFLREKKGENKRKLERGGRWWEKVC